MLFVSRCMSDKPISFKRRPFKSLSRVKTTLSSKSHSHIRNTEHFQTTTGAGSLELIKRANISIEAVLQKELKTMSAVK